MRRWFRGQLAGHYVGRPRTDDGAGLPHGQRGFAIDIYRAVVRDIELLADEPEPVPAEEITASAPQEGTDSTTEVAPKAVPAQGPPVPPATHHHAFEGPALHQAHIAKVHLIDAHGPGRTVRAAAIDVLASDVTFSHPASHNGKVYGRVEATVSGWYAPPADTPLPATTELPPEAPGIAWESKEVAAPSQDPVARELEAVTRAAAQELPDSPLDDPTVADATAHAALAGEAASPPATVDEATLVTAAPEEDLEKDPPLLATAMVIAALLGLLAAPHSALIWLLCFLPPFGLRKWLLGVVPEGPATSFAAYAIGFGELLLAASTVAAYYSTGCRSLGVGALLGTIAAVMVSSVLPRAFGFAASLLGLAAILFAYYARLGLPYCG